MHWPPPPCRRVEPFLSNGAVSSCSKRWMVHNRAMQRFATRLRELAMRNHATLGQFLCSSDHLGSPKWPQKFVPYLLPDGRGREGIARSFVPPIDMFSPSETFSERRLTKFPKSQRGGAKSLLLLLLPRPPPTHLLFIAKLREGV